MAEKIWLIGEHNPYGEKEKYALFPYPENSAGGRLCRKIFGMTAGEYLRTFERRNLMQKPKWAMGEGRAAAAEILKSAWPDPVVLLGKKVAGSFDLPFEPFSQTWYPSKDGPLQVHAKRGQRPGPGTAPPQRALQDLERPRRDPESQKGTGGHPPWIRTTAT